MHFDLCMTTFRALCTHYHYGDDDGNSLKSTFGSCILLYKATDKSKIINEWGQGVYKGGTKGVAVSFFKERHLTLALNYACSHSLMD